MSELQYKDLSEAELDYECRDFRRAAYAQWVAFREKRETKHKAEERWQAQSHPAIVRAFHSWRYRLSERRDDKIEEELLFDVSPFDGLRMHKQNMTPPLKPDGLPNNH